MPTPEMKSLNLMLAWMCADAETSRYDMSMPRASDGYVYATDGRRAALIDADYCGELMVDRDGIEVGKFPNLFDLFRQYEFESGEWKQLATIARSMARLESHGYDDDYIETFTRRNDMEFDGRLIDREFLWPFSLIPGITYQIQEQAMVLKWEGGKGLIMLKLRDV